MVAPLSSSTEARIIAFASACTLWHNSYRSPCGMHSSFLVHLPTSIQSFTPAAAPLYPVLTMMLSFVITAPYLRLRHVARTETAFAILIKYSSHPGLDWFFFFLETITPLHVIESSTDLL